MTITIKRSVIADALSIVAPFANQKHVLPILNFVKIATKGNRIKFETNNMQSSIRRYADAESIDGEGQFLVKCEELNSYVAKLKCDVITLTLQENTLTLSHPKGKSEFQVHDAVEYPSMELDDENTESIAVPSDVLCRYMQTGKSFVSSDELRPQLKAIYAYVKDGVFGYCATDTRILVNDETPIQSDKDIHWYVEQAIIPTISKACAAANKTTITISSSKVRYKIGDTIILSVQTKGEYPNFKRIIPKQFATSCVIDKKDLIESVDRVSCACNDTACIKVEAQTDSIRLSTEELGSVRTAYENVALNSACDYICIGLQYQYFMTCLKSISDDEVEMRFNGSNTPVVFHDKNYDNKFIVLMPMQL